MTYSTEDIHTGVLDNYNIKTNTAIAALLVSFTGKGKIKPVIMHHVMKAYRGSIDNDPHILNHNSRWNYWPAPTLATLNSEERDPSIPEEEVGNIPASLWMWWCKENPYSCSIGRKHWSSTSNIFKVNLFLKFLIKNYKTVQKFFYQK